MVGIDTGLPNRIVKEALVKQKIAPLADYSSVKPEQRYGENSRIDFLLRGPGLRDAYVEVKNVHLSRQDDWAEFPDSVTARGAKHLYALSAVARAGKRAAMLYCVQHQGCGRFRLAEDIDPTYAAAYREARSAGVEMLCFGCRIGLDGVALDRSLPIFVD